LFPNVTLRTPVGIAKRLKEGFLLQLHLAKQLAGGGVLQIVKGREARSGENVVVHGTEKWKPYSGAPGKSTMEVGVLGTLLDRRRGRSTRLGCIVAPTR
jgi:hypothetical protein